MSVILASKFQSLSDYENALRIAMYHKDHVNEDFSYCLSREAGVEQLSIIENGFPYVAFDSQGNVIDTNVKISLLTEDDVLLYRKGGHDRKVKEGFEKLNVCSSHTTAIDWVNEINQLSEKSKEELLGRKVKQITPEEISYAIKSKEIETWIPFFLKATEKSPYDFKSIREIITEPEQLSAFKTGEYKTDTMWQTGDSNAKLRYVYQHPDWFCGYRGSMEKGRVEVININSDMILSDLMDICVDGKADNGKEEYRCFVIGGKVSSISRYVDYEHIKVPADVAQKANEFTILLKDCSLPDHFVMDIARTEKGFQLVEINPFCGSGRYLDNDPEAMLRDLMRFYDMTSDLMPVDDAVRSVDLKKIDPQISESTSFDGLSLLDLKGPDIPEDIW